MLVPDDNKDGDDDGDDEEYDDDDDDGNDVTAVMMITIAMIITITSLSFFVLQYCRDDEPTLETSLERVCLIWETRCQLDNGCLTYLLTYLMTCLRAAYLLTCSLTS